VMEQVFSTWVMFGGQKNRDAACIIWLDTLFFLLGRRSFLTAKCVRIRQVSSVVVWESTYENLEDSSVVIGARC
jgi:hypothetical protein